MKKLFLAALTVLTLGAGVANAESFSHAAPSSHASQQQSGNGYNWLAGGD